MTPGRFVPGNRIPCHHPRAGSGSTRADTMCISGISSWLLSDQNLSQPSISKRTRSPSIVTFTIRRLGVDGSINVRRRGIACLKGYRAVKHLSDMKRSRPERAATRIRILAGSEVALGPGKADLLRAIDETGSISAAARRMRMSYRRAWLLVHTMNECFEPPLVEAVKGGAEGGGARLTPTGRRVLNEYSRVLQVAAERIGPYLRARK